MTRQWGRALKGQRIAEAAPQNRWQVLTTLGTMSLRGIEAAMTVPSATDDEIFRALCRTGAVPHSCSRRRADSG